MSMKKKKKRMPRKETLARNLINTCWNLKELNYLDKVIGEVYDLNKAKNEVYERRMKILDELYKEFLDDKVEFLKKYSKGVRLDTKKLVDEYISN